MTLGKDSSLLVTLDRLQPAWAMPENLRGSDTLEEKRVQLLNLAVLATALTGPLFAVVFWVQGSPWMAVPMLLGALVVLTPPLLVRMGYSLRLAGNWFSFQSWVAICAVIWMSGGPQVEGLIWLLYPPLTAMVFAGLRSGVAWTIISLLTCVAFYVASGRLIDFPDFLAPSSFVALVGPIALIGLNSLFFLLHAYLQGLTEAKLHRAQHAALEASRETFRTLIENSPDGIAVLRDGEIVYANPALTTLLGYDGDALHGRHALEFAANPAHSDMIDKAGDTVRQRGALSDLLETQLLHRDGHRIVAEVQAFAATFQGEQSTIVMIRDISERKELRAKMMHMDRMAAVGTLAAGVAHEINNPLGFIRANAQLLLSEFEHGAFDDWRPPESTRLDHQELREMLGDVDEGAERIQRIVAGLKTYTRHDERADASVDLEQLLESVRKMSIHLLRDRARLQIDLDALPPVRGTNSELGQVLLNLIVNAAHAIEPGRRDENTIRVTGRYRDGAVHISVEDTGSGIPADVQPKIFDPFFSTKEQDEGMGLGLYITRNIVENTGGDITFESVEGEGTRFDIRLGASDAPAADITGPIPKPRGSLRDGRILVVDDEPQIIKTLQRALSGYEVVGASSAKDALALLREGAQFDLILCDLSMPHMSGMAFFGILEDEFPGLSSRTLFMSGGTYTAEATRFVASLERSLINKPFDIDKLRCRVDKAMN